jgi:AAA+ ATPase superfamily predicted ATPase
MIVILILLYFIAFFGMLKSGFDYIEYLYEKEQQEQQEDKEEIKQKAIEKECKRVRRFLNADGSINTTAARAYMQRQEREKRKKIESISFEIIE